MSVLQVDFGAVAVSNADPIITLPNGAPSAGDVLYAMCFVAGSAARPTVPADWHLLAQSPGVFGPGYAVARKVCGAGESATQTPFHHSVNGVVFSASIWRMSGVADPSNYLIAQLNAYLRPTTPGPFSLTINPSAVGYALGGVFVDGNNWTVPAGFTSDGNSHNDIHGWSHRASFPTGSATYNWTTLPSGLPCSGMLLVIGGLSQVAANITKPGSLRIANRQSLPQAAGLRIIAPAAKTRAASLRIQAIGAALKRAALRISGGLPYNMGAALTIATAAVTRIGAALRVAGGIPYNVRASLKIVGGGKATAGASLVIAAPTRPVFRQAFSLETAVAINVQLP